MSISIRLSRTGRKNSPAYKIVVSNTRDKRNGRFIDIIGHFNPSEKPQKFEYDKKKFADWKSKGALTSKAVESLIEGTYTYTPYKPLGAKKGSATPEVKE